MVVKIRGKTFRQKLKGPDEFISFNQRALQYIKENTRKIILVFTFTVIVIVSIGFFIKWYAAQREAFFSKTYEEVMLANSTFSNNQYDVAVKLFEEIAEENDQSSLFNEIAQVGIGYSLMENKEYEKSIKIFEDLVARSYFQYPREELYNTLAILYEKTGKHEKTIEIYQKLVAFYPQSNDIALYLSKIEKSGQFQHP